jgi:hypothetical protein
MESGGHGIDGIAGSFKESMVEIEKVYGYRHATLRWGGWEKSIFD